MQGREKCLCVISHSEVICILICVYPALVITFAVIVNQSTQFGRKEESIKFQTPYIAQKKNFNLLSQTPSCDVSTE